jgi:FtsZ-binding cell division protein ZapB
MNIQLVDSLAQIINTLTPEEKQVLQTKIDLVTTNNNLQIKEESWHNFIENTYGSIEDETFIRQPQDYITPRESIE